MAPPDRGRTSSPSPGHPSGVPISTSPGSVRSRNYGTSLPRADTTARLASPVPSHAFGASPRNASPLRHANNAAPSGDFAPLPGPGQGNSGPGVSALAAALSNSLGMSPPRFGTPPARPHSPAGSASFMQQLEPTNYGSFDARSRSIQGGNTGAYEDPEIVRRHLVRPSTPDLTEHGKGKQTGEWAESVADDDEFSSLRLQGGDITRPIYKWSEEADGRLRPQRSKSFSISRPEPQDEVLDINTIKVPGGFRRNYIRRSAVSPSGDPSNVESGHRRPRDQPQLFTNSFLEFLSIYGHFAGEQLEEDDEDLLPGEYFSSGEDEFESDEGSDDDREPMEDSALLTPSRRRRKRKSRGGSGNVSQLNATLLLLKSFVGTGVLFLPRAYLSGGMVFSNLILVFVAALSYYCFVLLVNTRLKIVGSFGDLGGILYGRWLRNLILSSIVISQIGFVSAYTVFTAENLQAAILAVSNCSTYIPIPWLIVMQMVIFLPFALLRDIGKLGFTALIADAFIVIGLAYLLYYDIITLNANGVADIIYFNPKDWTLFIGTAIFTFEGIGLIIPVQESMKSPKKFPKVMLIVMVIISVLFIGMGAISYAAYGSKTETVVLLNLPQGDKFVNGVQFLYSIAILLSTPLQIFPAIKITENALFTRSGKYNPYIKWQKNMFRFFIVFVCAFVSWIGADNLDKFVALVGNFACIPLVYIYPPLLHYRAVARTRFGRISDIALGVFGFIAMAYATSLTIVSWANGPTGPPLPKYCDDPKL